MNTNAIASNPFALMMAPDEVLKMMERSDSLRQLAHRECHPLDGPVRVSANAEQAAFDAAVEQTEDALH